MIETLVLSVTSFIGTNIDDLLINTLLFAGAENRSDQRHIFIGKYLGIGALVLLSMLGAAGLQFLSQRSIGLLGLVPICLGVKEILSSFVHNKADEHNEIPEKSSNLALSTALITIANGADNIGVYIPLFADFAFWQLMLTIIVFSVLVFASCLLSRSLSGMPVLKSSLSSAKQFIVPLVYIALGVYILAKSFIF